MKERKLYSLTGKLIVFLLLIVFAASALFGGIQTLMLSSVGLTPNAAAKKYAFEETTACGTLVQRQLHNVMSYYNDMSKFGTNGRYDGTKEIDFVAVRRDERIYVQVCRRLPEESDREVANLLEIKDHYPKYVVTLDELAAGNINGVKIVHLADFLLSDTY